jgi:hypothetical protein
MQEVYYAYEITLKLVSGLHRGMEYPEVVDGGGGSQIRRIAENISKKQSRTAGKGWSSRLGVGRRANPSP